MRLNLFMLCARFHASRAWLHRLLVGTVLVGTVLVGINVVI